MRKFIVLIFVTPLLLLMALIIYRVQHPIQNKEVITRVDLKHTQTNWSQGEFTPISTNEDFFYRLKRIQIKGDDQLNEPQKESLRNALVNLVLGNYLGDYESYLKFRVPITNYSVSPAAMDILKTSYKSIYPSNAFQNSFEQADRQVWDHFYSGHPYWLGINFSNLTVSVLTTNAMPDVYIFKTPPFYPVSAAIGVTLTSDLGFCFNSSMEKTLATDKKLAVAQITIMVDAAEPQKKPRPFFYVLTLDTQDGNVWLPFQLTHLSTEPFQDKGPF